MNRTLAGLLCGFLAAFCFGTNPLGALKLQEQGLNTSSVLIWRFMLAFILLAIWMLAARESFKVTLKEFKILAILGVSFCCSSLFLFSSFNYMDAGIAETMLFVYPILVAIIMGVFFHERIRWPIILAIVLALSGIVLLYQGDGNMHISGLGVGLVLLAALSDASYIIIINRSNLMMTPKKLNFYVLGICLLSNIVQTLLRGEPFIFPSNAWGYAYVLWLALVPSILGSILLVLSVQKVGSTVSAILGAFEPVTAVVIGVTLFHELFSLQRAAGIALVLGAVLFLVISQKKTQTMTKAPMSIPPVPAEDDEY